MISSICGSANSSDEKNNFKVKNNPLDWLDWIINGDSFKNFFEGTVTDYNADGMSGDSWGWENITA